MLRYSVLLFAMVLHVLTLRADILQIPLLARTPAQIGDSVWKVVRHSANIDPTYFNERYTDLKRTWVIATLQVRDLVTSELSAKLSTPYIGEPLGIPAVLRFRTEIKSVCISKGIMQKEELFQRLHEGIYPVLVVSCDDTSHMIILHEELSSHELGTALAESSEGVLIQLP